MALCFGVPFIEGSIGKIHQTPKHKIIKEDRKGYGLFYEEGFGFQVHTQGDIRQESTRKA